MDSVARKGLILPGTFFSKFLEPLLSALDFQCIVDTGCEAIGVIGYQLVPDLVRTKAESPIRLIGARSNSLKALKALKTLGTVVLVARAGILSKNEIKR